MKYRLLSLLLLLQACLISQAAGFRPIITNYSPADYGLSTGSQIWGCSQDQNGVVYFANNKGLLVYDGDK